MTFGADVFGVYVQSPDDHGELVDLKPLIERAHAAGALVAVGTDLLALALADASRRGRRGRRGRQRAAIRRAARLRRAPRGVLRDTRALRPAGAGPDYRRVGGQPRAGARTAWPSRRASSTSAARRRRRTSARRRRCWPTWRRSTRCTTGPTASRRSRARVHDQTGRLAEALQARRLATDESRPTSTRCASRVTRPRVAQGAQAAESRGINFRYPAPGVVQISLNETVTECDLADVAVVFSADGRPRRSARSSTCRGRRWRRVVAPRRPRS